MAGRSSRCWAVLALIAAAACGGSTIEEVVGPSDARCNITVGVNEPFQAAGGRLVVPLTAARDCTWSLEPIDPGLSAEPRSGQGDGTLTVTVGANPLGRVRMLTIRINQQQFTIPQEPSPCHYTITPSDVDVRAEGGRVRVRLDTLEGCSWRVIPNESWVQAISPREGDGAGLIELSVHSNTAGRRTTAVQIGPVTLAVRQASISDSARGCPYSIGKGAANFPASGGEGVVRLHTRPNCAWGATVNEPWVVIVSGPEQIGTGDIHYRVEPNPSTRRRTATIDAGGARHIVNQAASR